jgi:hypothetical protein
MKLSSNACEHAHTHKNASVKLLQLLVGVNIKYITTTLPNFCPTQNNIQQTLHTHGFVHCSFTYLWKTCSGNPYKP